MSDCIEHTQNNANGYGTISVKINGVWTMQKLHRMAYCTARGLHISDIRGKVVMHTCDNPRCINPDHLVLGTQSDNNRDRVAKGRCARGTQISAKLRRLNIDDVMRIRGLHAYAPDVFSGYALAGIYPVSQAAISKILRGVSYPEVPAKDMDASMIRTWASRLTGYAAYRADKLLRKLF